MPLPLALSRLQRLHARCSNARSTPSGDPSCSRPPTRASPMLSLHRRSQQPCRRLNLLQPQVPATAPGYDQIHIQWWTAWPIYMGSVTTTWQQAWPRPWRDRCVIEQHSTTAIVQRPKLSAKPATRLTESLSSVDPDIQTLITEISTVIHCEGAGCRGRHHTAHVIVVHLLKMATSHISLVWKYFTVDVAYACVVDTTLKINSNSIEVTRETSIPYVLAYKSKNLGQLRGLTYVRVTVGQHMCHQFFRNYRWCQLSWDWRTLCP